MIVGGIKLVPAVGTFQCGQLPPVQMNHNVHNVEVNSTAEGGPAGLEEQQVGGGDVRHISTTQAEVERAKSDLENRHISPKSVRESQSLLSGRGGKKKSTGGKTSKAKKKSAPKKKSSSSKKSKSKNNNNKKKKKPKKSGGKSKKTKKSASKKPKKKTSSKKKGGRK